MKSLNAIVAITLGLALAGCSNSEDLSVMGPGVPRDNAEASAKPSTSIQFETLERNAEGPFMAQCTELFESPAQWDAAMAAMAENGQISILPAPEAPKVNWKHESVILVALGEFPTGDAGIEVVGMHLEGDKAILDVVVSPRGPYAYMTAPYHVIKFNNRNKGIQSVEYRAL